MIRPLQQLRYSLFLLFLLPLFPVHAANAPKPKRQQPSANNSQSNAKAQSDSERDFDKIRQFRSYDPLANDWTNIERFQGVEILKDTTQHRPDNYLYQGFWAYDAKTERWYKVDIRDYGYLLRGVSGEATASAKKEEELKEKPKKKPFRFWKNLILSLRAGGGMTFYNNTLHNLYLEERDGSFYVQTVGAFNTKQGEGYLMRWFGDVPVRKRRFTKKRPDNPIVVPPEPQAFFTGTGWNFPITLTMHYTFFNRLRLGGGAMLEINQLKELTPQGGASGKVDKFTAAKEHIWFYNMNWLGLAAFKIIHQPRYDVLIDFQIGSNYNTGIHLKKLFTENTYAYAGIIYSAGLSYERRLNNHFRFLTRLSGDLKFHQDAPVGGDSTAHVDYRQIALHLEVGINFSFGKEVIEERPRLEEEGKDTKTDPVQKIRQSQENLKNKKRSLQNKRDEAESDIETLKDLKRPSGIKDRLKRNFF